MVSSRTDRWSAELAFDLAAELGEAPHWDARTGELVCVDIPVGAVHRRDPRSGADRSFGVGQPIGAAVPRASGGLVLALRDGIAAVDNQGGGLEWISTVGRADRRTRMNDAKCDSAGRLWAGTMDMEETKPIGALYRLDASHVVETMVSGVTVSNGLGWSPDGTLFYYIDSPRAGVDVFDFDLATGAIANRRRLVTFATADGEPDGLAVDEEGCLWVAFWEGWAVRRYRPDGELVGIVDVPVARVTCPAFGGDDLATLYVTTASPDKPDPRQPHAGGVFELRPGCRGFAAQPYAG
jgi:sugar lactone lactonase YvrE